MDEFNICSNALAYFNYELLRDNFDNDSDRNIKICKMKLHQALRKVIREKSWSFLTEEIPLEKDTTADIFDTKLSHVFILPDNLLSIVSVFGARSYRRFGNKLFCDSGDIKFFGILDSDILPSNAPKDFEDLISIALAYIIAPIITPEASVLIKQLMMQYSWILGK